MRTGLQCKFPANGRSAARQSPQRDRGIPIPIDCRYYLSEQGMPAHRTTDVGYGHLTLEGSAFDAQRLALHLGLEP